MAITPQQARAELARRELARRGVPLEAPQQPNMMQTLSGLQQGVENKIAQRPSVLGELEQDPLTAQRVMQHPVGSLLLRPVRMGAQLLEGGAASAGLAAQRGDLGGVIPEAYQAFTGRRPAELGDIMRGVDAPEGVSATVGMMGSLGLGGRGPAKEVGKGAGAVGRKAGQAVSNIPYPFKDVIKYSKPKNRINLVDDVYNKYMQFRQDLTDIFGGEYEKIVGESKNRVNLMNPINEWFQDHGTNIMNNQDFKKAFKSGDPTANKIYKIIQGLTDPNTDPKLIRKLSDMSVQEADDFRKYFEGLPGIRSKLKLSFNKGKGMVDLTNDERILLDLSKRIKGEVIDKEPMLGGLNEFYAQGKNDINIFRQNILGKNKDSTLKNLRSYSNNPNFDFTRESSQRIFGNDTLKKIQDFNRAEDFKSLLIKLGIGAGVAAGGGTVAGIVGNKLKN